MSHLDMWCLLFTGAETLEQVAQESQHTLFLNSNPRLTQWCQSCCLKCSIPRHWQHSVDRWSKFFFFPVLPMCAQGKTMSAFVMRQHTAALLFYHQNSFSSLATFTVKPCKLFFLVIFIADCTTKCLIPRLLSLVIIWKPLLILY